MAVDRDFRFPQGTVNLDVLPEILGGLVLELDEPPPAHVYRLMETLGVTVIPPEPRET